MGVQRSRFHASIGNPPGQTVRTEIIEPIKGLDVLHAATQLSPGETPFSQNFTLDGRFLTPRSGMSQWGTSGLTNKPLGMIVGVAFDEQDAILLPSTTTVTARYAGNDGGNWSGNISGTPTLTSGSTAYYSWAPVQQLRSQSILPGVVFCNKDRPPMLAGADVSSGISILTGFYSIDSYAKYCASFDQRVLLFNSGKTFLDSVADTHHPNRVTWTARGSVANFTDGGFEDLIDMDGTGTGIIPEADRVVLFSQKEVWAGRPRRDAFAFDFFLLDRSRGLPDAYDKSLQNTEAGTIWLGDGFQFYRLVGNEVRALGDKVRKHLRENMKEPVYSFSVFNPTTHVYALFYSDVSGGHCNKALFLRTDTIQPTAQNRDDGSWFMQDFGSYEFAAGAYFAGNTALVSSAGTPYRLLSSQTNDAGTAIDCRWRSHALRGDKDILPYEMLQEMWLETFADSNSSINVHTSTNAGGSFTTAGTASVTSGFNEEFVPISVPAAQNSMFELRLNDGSQPKISRINLRLRSYTGRFSGS